MKYILVLAAALLTAAAAHSNDETGNVLLSNCSEAVRFQDGILDVDSEKALTCLAFLDGLKAAMTLWQEVDKASSITCIPMGVNNGQASRIIVEYGRKNPSILHHHPIVLAVQAFQDAFPCEEV
jgi:hypothetical protein